MSRISAVTGLATGELAVIVPRYSPGARLLESVETAKVAGTVPELGVTFSHGALVLLGHKVEHSDVELFCGNTPVSARSTREALRGLCGQIGERRGA